MRIPRQTLHVEDRRADAEAQMLRRERVGGDRGHLLIIGGAVISELIERSENGVAAEAARRELLRELFGYVGGH